jgi:formate dehydrogenase maturation protein FdhE
MKIDLNTLRPVNFHKNINLTLKNAINRISKKSGWKKVSYCPVCGSNKKNLFLIKLKINI